MAANSIGLDICIPAFAYSISERTRHAVANAIAVEISSSADELGGMPAELVEVRNACCLADRDLEHIFATLTRTGALEGARRVAHIAPEQLSTALMTSLRNFRTDVYLIDLGSLNPIEFSALKRGYDISAYGLLARHIEAYGLRTWCAQITLGIPGQTERTLRDNVRRLIDLAPGAVWTRLEKGGANMVPLLAEHLTEAGYRQVGARSFALPGYETCAPGAIARPRDVWGFGPGAMSVLDGQALVNELSLENYVKRVQRPEHGARGSRPVTCALHSLL